MNIYGLVWALPEDTNIPESLTYRASNTHDAGLPRKNETIIKTVLHTG